jgi:quercetin dioxygenase-like cupin family protein
MKVRNFDLVKAMQIGTKSISALLLATITMAPAAVSPASSYNDIVKTIFSHPISNVPGKSLVAAEVSYPPGGASAPHRHSAFVYAYVVSGQIASQVEGQPERIYRAGESWYETPGAHHLIGRNASNTEPAKLLAVFIADTGDNALTTPDQAGGSR